MQDVATEFLKENEPQIIMQGYEYLREVMSLYAKLHNLLDSTLELLECNMSEEAFILLRSMLNNQMWIVYLCEDDSNRSRLKKYLIQPLITKLNLLDNIKKVSHTEWFTKMNDSRKDKIDIEEVKKEIRAIKDILHKENIPSGERKPVSVAKLAKSNELMFGLYISIYSDASRYEHSDPSVLNLYRQKILDDYDSTNVFKVDLSSTSEDLKKKILEYAKNIYGFSFIHIVQHITKKEEHLLRYYNEEKLGSLMLAMMN